MTVCWFAQSRTADLACVVAAIAEAPGVARAVIHTPATTHDPYLNDGAPPGLALQVYCDTIEALEAALAGPLQALASCIPPDGTTQQAMLVRSFPVREPAVRETMCAYLVAYEGTAEDLPTWLSHYIAHHAAIMTRFPFIRAVEVYTRIDWCGGLPWARADHMQRNKVVFDDPAALTAALNSPVRHEMRADFAKFPAFAGPVTHFPMAARTIYPYGETTK